MLMSSSPSRSPSPELVEQPAAKQPRLAIETDIGVFVAEQSSQSVTDHEKYQLTVHQWFFIQIPKADNGRSFPHNWLTRYSWLRYSKHDNSGYCLSCVLFARSVDFALLQECLWKTPSPIFRKHLSFSTSMLIKSTTGQLLWHLWGFCEGHYK